MILKLIFFFVLNNNNNNNNNNIIIIIGIRGSRIYVGPWALFEAA